MTKTPEELTEDWKAGKLVQDKDYYVETMASDVVIDFYGQLYDESHYPQDLGFDNVSNGFVKRILAPVPSYDEYKAMQAELAELKEKIKKREKLIQCLGSNIDELDVKKSVLIIENNKLRGLLKECKEWFECFAWNKEYKHKSVNILARINAAIDESEKR